MANKQIYFSVFVGLGMSLLGFWGQETFNAGTSLSLAGLALIALAVFGKIIPRVSAINSSVSASKLKYQDNEGDLKHIAQGEFRDAA